VNKLNSCMTLKRCLTLFVVMFLGLNAYAYDKATQEAQAALSQKGYSPGPADGIFGNKTEQEVRAFQRDNNLSETGTLDEGTLKALGVTSTPAKKTHTVPIDSALVHRLSTWDEAPNWFRRPAYSPLDILLEKSVSYTSRKNPLLSLNELKGGENFGSSAPIDSNMNMFALLLFNALGKNSNGRSGIGGAHWKTLFQDRPSLKVFIVPKNTEEEEYAETTIVKHGGGIKVRFVQE